MYDIPKLLAALAQNALHEELNTYPKPGLVSPIDQGSHPDMDYGLFLVSINQLASYFKQVASTAMMEHDFAVLELLGLQAEQRLLSTTHHINTHRGAIFILGLIVAATAYCVQHQLPYTHISQTIPALYAQGLSEHKIDHNSHGYIIRQQYTLESIIDSALKGFPLIFSATAQLRQFEQHYDNSQTKLRTFFYIMQQLDDTNLVHRGGIGALEFARSEATRLLTIEQPENFIAQALDLHHEFIRRNLSPGGCADIFAATLFIDQVEQLWV